MLACETPGCEVSSDSEHILKHQVYTAFIPAYMRYILKTFHNLIRDQLKVGIMGDRMIIGCFSSLQFVKQGIADMRCCPELDKYQNHD